MELQPDSAQHDDGKRVLLAMMVIMGMLLLWGYLFPSRQPPPQAQEDTQPKPTTATPSTATPTTATPVQPRKPPELRPATHTPTTAAPTTATPAQPPVAPKPPEPTPQPPPRITVKRSALFTAEFSNHDAALARLILLDYFRTPLTKAAARKARARDPEADLTEFGLPLLGQPGTGPSLVVVDRVDKGTDDREAEPAAGPKLFAPRRFELVDEGERHVVFRSTFLAGRLELTKTFTLPAPDAKLQRHLEVAIQLKNLGTAPLPLPGYRLRGCGGIAVDQGPRSWKKLEPTEAERKAASRYMGSAVATETESGDVNVKRLSSSKLQKKDLVRSEGGVLWAAAETNYFAALLEPLREKDERKWVWSGGAEALGEANLTANIQTASTTLEPGQTVVHRYRFFAGPKAKPLLAAYGYDRLRKRGWLDPLVTVMALILRGAHAVIPNYGIAILILTLIVRAGLHPLSKKSQTSMQKMQKLQPQMQEIREKYKSDKRRQQEELMKLHRDYGVNPLGGCLPMILQLPIFIGLFRALRESIELRHEAFLFVRDLSQPDNFMGVVNILPLISTAIMFIQQRMMPKSADPQQQQTQKIMGYMMPAFIGYIFYGFPSGLALYFIASMGIGILEQKLIKRHMDKMGDLKPVARKPAKPPKKHPANASRKRKAF